jgi:hypothetical protein
MLGNRVVSIPLLTFLVSKCCPVQAFKVMCSMNPCSSSSSEFSINYKGNIIPITYSKFQHRLNRTIKIHMIIKFIQNFQGNW